MRRFTLGLISALVAIGCRTAPEAPARTGAGDATAPAATLRSHMREHFAAITALQSAITHGQLDQAKVSARWIVEHDEGTPAEWEAQIAAMRAAASEVIAATNLTEAASLAGTLGRTCADCHEAHHVTVAFSWTEPPQDAPDLASQMRLHAWGAVRLWEGLVGPSDELWHQGASTLAATHLDSAPNARGDRHRDIPVYAERVRDVAAYANTQHTSEARARVYGELLATCAGCHALTRPRN